MRDGAQWFVENTDIKLVGNDDPLQGEIAWNRTPRELGLSAYALQQLGGSHAATPNQIRELMKVDGLTNDEVKSHLQGNSTIAAKVY
ncbi:protein PHOSPHATE STARVATION RESPONSE 1-like isoform X2 [Malus sylvestris]|uniref:protein PHOSPHATE STARVATION RESPONSE 1-like isoform X2 n=1 Tax=Malus sylvestris TaxID=3752 RepID=UPI0021AD2F34|nr:protein PHOSPHATE STARVATION RESPONSE 1-like isoform X2 [Malus sylvestris]